MACCLSMTTCPVPHHLPVMAALYFLIRRVLIFPRVRFNGTVEQPRSQELLGHGGGKGFFLQANRSRSRCKGGALLGDSAQTRAMSSESCEDDQDNPILYVLVCQDFPSSGSFPPPPPPSCYQANQPLQPTNCSRPSCTSHLPCCDRRAGVRLGLLRARRGGHIIHCGEVDTPTPSLRYVENEQRKRAKTVSRVCLRGSVVVAQGRWIYGSVRDRNIPSMASRQARERNGTVPERFSVLELTSAKHVPPGIQFDFPCLLRGRLRNRQWGVETSLRDSQINSTIT